MKQRSVSQDPPISMSEYVIGLVWKEAREAGAKLPERPPIHEQPPSATKVVHDMAGRVTSLEDKLGQLLDLLRAGAGDQQGKKGR